MVMGERKSAVAFILGAGCRCLSCPWRQARASALPSFSRCSLFNIASPKGASLPTTRSALSRDAKTHLQFQFNFSSFVHHDPCLPRNFSSGHLRIADSSSEQGYWDTPRTVQQMPNALLSLTMRCHQHPCLLWTRTTAVVPRPTQGSVTAGTL